MLSTKGPYHMRQFHRQAQISQSCLSRKYSSRYIYIYIMYIYADVSDSTLINQVKQLVSISHCVARVSSSFIRALLARATVKNVVTGDVVSSLKCTSRLTGWTGHQAHPEHNKFLLSNNEQDTRSQMLHGKWCSSW